MTLLQLAIMVGHVDTVDYLLGYGNGGLYVLDSNGRSALHTAAAVGDPIVTRLLLESGANPILKDDLSYTPLHMAVLNDNCGVISILL